MQSNYPAALDDLTAAQDDHGADATAAWFLPAAVEAVQETLGVTPSGEYDDVAARLDALSEAVVAPPAEPAEITGQLGDDDTEILSRVLQALDGLGLIDNATTPVAPE